MTGYVKFVIYGFLALFLTGTVTVPVAAEPGRNITKIYFSFQHKGDKKSVRRPAVRRDLPSERSYRQNRAREALKSGRIVALSVIRRRIRQSFPGKIVDVRLLEPQRKERPYIYVVKLLGRNGKLLVLRVNANTARILRVRGND